MRRVGTGRRRVAKLSGLAAPAGGEPVAIPAPRSVRTPRQPRCDQSGQRDVAMAESIPKAKSAYAFFQAAMNKQMVGVPLGSHRRRCRYRRGASTFKFTRRGRRTAARRNAAVRKLNAGERMQEISARWKALADKSPYEAQAAADKRDDEASAARDAQVLAEQEAKRKAREGGGRGTKRAAAPVSEAPKPKKERKPRVLSEKQQAERSAKQSERSARESRMDAEREALDGRLADAAQARLKFLLSQSDIFGHFGAGATAAAASKKKETQEVKSPVKTRRGRTLEEDDLETKEEEQKRPRDSRASPRTSRAARCGPTSSRA